jgi:hypothetical protein
MSLIGNRYCTETPTDGSHRRAHFTWNEANEANDAISISPTKQTLSNPDRDHSYWQIVPTDAAIPDFQRLLSPATFPLIASITVFAPH